MARYISVEQPDTEAKVDFMGPYGFTVTIRHEPNNKVYVSVIADDDQNTILGEILADIPPADDRR